MNHQSLAVLVGATLISAIAALTHPDAPPVGSSAAFGLPVALAMAASASWPAAPFAGVVAGGPDLRALFASAEAWPHVGPVGADAFAARGYR